jgi:hypothetical protein
MLKHSKALLKNFIKELKRSKPKDNTAFVYVIYDHNFNSGINEGFLYVATPWNAVKILLKDYEAVNMIQEGLKIPFTKAHDVEAPSQGKILSGYYKRFRDGQGGFQEVKPEALPDIKLIKDFFRHEEAYIKLKDTRLIQIDNQQEFLRIFTSTEEGKPEEVKHHIKNNIFEGVDMKCFTLYGKKESATHRPMVLTSGEFYDNSSPIYIITPVRYQQ